jgi:hypothetical protein
MRNGLYVDVPGERFSLLVLNLGSGKERSRGRQKFGTRHEKKAVIGCVFACVLNLFVRAHAAYGLSGDEN